MDLVNKHFSKEEVNYDPVTNDKLTGSDVTVKVDNGAAEPWG